MPVAHTGVKCYFLFSGALRGQAVPKFSPGSFFMGAVKYRLGKERRHNNQTVYCTAAWFRGGLASVWWPCLTVQGGGK